MAIRTVSVKLGERSYPINMGRTIDTVLQAPGKGTAALVVSDTNVAPRYLDGCRARLTELGYLVESTVIPAGEQSKCLEQADRLYTAAVAAGLDRHSTIVALGGGVVGDLAGFVAGTFLRGVRFVQAPTTLLAMVDSSVGGKTGINLAQGKNLVGVFCQPVEVAMALDTLTTLSDREYRSGLAEVIKYGIIWDATFFDLLERETPRLLARDSGLLMDVVARSCEIKAEIVGIDERELGVRAVLNFGHTLGHAVENAVGYGTLLHGEAVAIGMVFAARLSTLLRGLPEAECDRIVALIQRVGLPVAAAGAVAEQLAWPTVRHAMATDKKAQGRVPRFVLAERLGAVVFNCEVDEECLATVYGTANGG
jgi:3-dehydroquinate synthase